MLEPPRELDAIANRVIGSALEVHRHLGPGFLESVYEEAVATNSICVVWFERQKSISVFYKDRPVWRASRGLAVETI